MQKLTRNNLLFILNSRDFSNGESYCKRGCVLDYVERRDDDDFEIQCKVRGSSMYTVHVKCGCYSGFYRASGECSCPRYADKGICKHIAAALFAHIELEEDPEKYSFRRVEYASKTSRSARDLLKRMRDMTEAAAEPASPAEDRLAHVAMTLLTPGPLNPNAFRATFKVGYDRLYAVRSISDFVERFEKSETFAYGKQLTLTHDESRFDETSRKIIEFLRAQIYQQAASYQNTYLSLSKVKDQLMLPVNVMDIVFDDLREMGPLNSKGGPCRLIDQDPKVALSVASNGEAVGVKLDISPVGMRFIAGSRRLFCYDDATVMRCGRAFGDNMRWLLENAGRNDLMFAREDMPAFCSLVLPRLSGHVTVDDPEGLLEQYLPEECTPRYYFDTYNSGIRCSLVYHYANTDIPAQSNDDFAGIRRDPRAEEAAKRRLRDFAWDGTARAYVLDDEDRAIALLTDGLADYREVGEVFVSDRLRDREISRPKATVGISVSDGMLTLSFDTGGFPPEELERLYESMLLKRRYHRLRDGRFIRLYGDGSGIEAVAETAHMTQISEGDLKKGQTRMPAFRALYLDSVLDKREGLRVRRDEAFRDMIRRFKTVEDSDYALPEQITGELRPYQETGYRWLKTLESCHFGGILADEMGLGKTIQMIAYFASMPRSRTGLPNLVVCPASLVLNWNDELARFAPGLGVKLISGTLKERRAMFAQEDAADVWVTSYDLLKRDIDQYADRHFYACVLDEGQFVKNQSTKASKAVKQIDCRQRFVLTGTPIENRLSELWNLFDYLMPGYLFSHQRFVERLEKPIIQKSDAEAGEQLNRLVHPFILRRLKRDVLKELPDKIEHVRRIQLSEAEKKVYHAQSAAALKQLSNTQERLAVLAALTRLRQICCDPNLCFENYEGETSKLDACMELLRSMTENGHQILLFSQFTSMLDRIRERLDAEHISSFTLQGSTPKNTRAQLVKDFNAGGAGVFLISLKAGGTGLNLTAADVVIHYDPWWNIAAQNQATDRAHRIGQINCVHVYKLIAEGTVEERIMELQKRKELLLDTVTEGSGEDIMHMSQEQLLELISAE